MSAPKRMAPTFLGPVASKNNLDGKTEGQKKEYEYLKNTKVLGPLLEKEERKGISKDPLKKKLKKEPKSDTGEHCSKTKVGQGGRKYIESNGKRIYVDKRSK